MFYTDYLNKNSKGNLYILKHYVYSVSNFRPLGLCQETNNWSNFRPLEKSNLKYFIEYVGHIGLRSLTDGHFECHLYYFNLLNKNNFPFKLVVTLSI